MSLGKFTSKKQAIPGFGPKSSEALVSIGIYSLDELKTRDVYEVYRLLKHNVPGTSLNFLYGMIAAIEGRDWRDVQKKDRTQILMRLDDMGLAPK